MSVPPTKEFLKNLKRAWRDEMVSALMYRTLAGQEENSERRAILQRMAEAEDRHAERWAVRLRDLGADPGPFVESPLEKLRKRVILNSDTESAAKMLEAREADADKLYTVLMASALTEADRTALLEAQQEENAHSLMLAEMAAPQPAYHPQRRLDRILGAEKWHVTAGGWIGQAIYGVNDGLGAAFGVVSGVAGATSANGEFVLLSGLAAAIASALSMGSGAYLATKSEREVYEAELDRERRELEEHPEEEREEMELFYQLKGFTPEEAKALTERLAQQPEHMLKALAHEELGLSEQSFPNPWKSAISATISTAVGAAVPVLPFLFWSGATALIIAFVVSTAAHFAVGASKVLVTGRSWVKSGTEMTVIGLGGAIITYAIGLLIAPMIG
jgi:predicted membrane protein (TIGR00267 family)